ncbi:DUF559 domain-containing protein [Rhodococcus sp. G-MC3]|uniref:endonuclease domain-containing protein n=1 Tax=Rhodococcus sp. G-MC3 TaxID=3046209 RepID=UPI0024BA09AE|nr:DUF559 domain-containing protein [Rhodococcus sp. G-MC3]MDJ0395122.1 DUF559 domain-containing protein [Rhodococcus sp. G-MC3]
MSDIYESHWHGASAWYRAVSNIRVTLLVGANALEVAANLDPLPPGAPAVITIPISIVRSQGQVVTLVLDGLETAARAMFPTWLPGAEDLAGPNRLDLMAARKLAADLASQSDHFGPFVSAMAESGLLGRSMNQPFIDRTLAEGLRRLIASTYERSLVTVLLSVDSTLTTEQQVQLVGASEWLCQRGGFTVWIVGPDDIDSDRVQPFDISPPATKCAGTAARNLVEIHVPAVAGKPHPGSEAEKKLERALLRCGWAFGREWNQPFQLTPLHERFVVDLRWPDEHCVVEVDGEDHRQKVKFERDRERDVVLQVHGHAVLRFTNRQIFDDVAAVVSAIENFIENKRSVTSRSTHTEGTPSGE